MDLQETQHWVGHVSSVVNSSRRRLLLYFWRNDESIGVTLYRDLAIWAMIHHAPTFWRDHALSMVCLLKSFIIKSWTLSHMHFIISRFRKPQRINKLTLSMIRNSLRRNPLGMDGLILFCLKYCFHRNSLLTTSQLETDTERHRISFHSVTSIHRAFRNIFTFNYIIFCEFSSYSRPANESESRACGVQLLVRRFHPCFVSKIRALAQGAIFYP